MVDPKEQEFFKAQDEAYRKRNETYHKWIGAERGEWIEAHREFFEADRNCGAAIRKLREYRKSKAQQGGKVGE